MQRLYHDIIQFHKIPKEMEMAKGKRKKREDKKKYIPGLRGQRRHSNNDGLKMIKSGWAHERLKKFCERLGLKCV